MDSIFTSDVDFSAMDNPYFLIGAINRFNNQFQCVADSLFEGITWKQIFLMNCISLFKKAPSLNELSDFVGCSHQNAKQILIKLEKSGFVRVENDKADKRKQLFFLTEKADSFRANFFNKSDEAMKKLFSNIGDEEVKITIKVILRLIDTLGNMDGEIDDCSL